VIVVDASLALKWYLQEPLSDEAEGLLAKHSGSIAAPDILIIEVIGALVRRANIDKAERPASHTSIAAFLELFTNGFVKRTDLSERQMARAAMLALDLGHPLKDCIYLALAMELGCDLVTCDARFAAKARAVWAGIRVLGV
jgi:predicted nucleic acid-binding protein